MINDAVKKLQKEKRVLTLGQLVDAICSGQLRNECGLDRHAFAQLVGTTRKTIRGYEAWEVAPRMGDIFSIATSLGIKLQMPGAHDGSN
ncbi:helix-turn-helix transcriptional regulator [Buttiauxella sp. B2]|uniref:helix-turn-helix domain-containing protein n=1 Tax=Buttiauxella sp. B2 TaxID=2587812 RepID=UPI001124ABD0|nr:helix-turn-helix transcriptional regulator [Buttiauxella sp. B2]TNV22497.1 helix-turn-helix transcriptional regulator [Buttiauxella sp. B2]